MKKLDKDYVWECDYGIRKPLIPALKELLSEQDATSLQMVNLLTNSIPYNLEFYIVLSYDNPKEDHIDVMKRLMLGEGLRYRPDITFHELQQEIGNRRFNSQTLVRDCDVERAMESGFLFQFSEKSEIEKLGYIIDKPLGNQMPIFLSHSSKNKSEVEDLIPYINGAGLPVWFDKVNIDYGESIVKAIQKGIKQSAGVIFWITNDFINSNWCDLELTKFANRYASKRDILTIAVVHQDVDIEEIDFLFDDIKYLKRTNEDLEIIAKEIIPTLKRYMDSIK
ncbi:MULTISPECIES: toll/interleukin-1 receptor domain-containing protein [unclassified Bacillus (in: firmicutes)]|uniref:toll/interleukin-1 receptor domain-containing protein n=1 Tax=unclassified Bacillus (in: firmicutes) TaxID=185979 RepID=UPI0030F96A09